MRTSFVSTKSCRVNPLFAGCTPVSMRMASQGQASTQKPQEMERVDRQVSPEAITRDHQAAYDLREIEAFPETHLFDSLHTRKSATYFTYKGMEPFVKERMR